jgi:hypothetical protein
MLFAEEMMDAIAQTAKLDPLDVARNFYARA